MTGKPYTFREMKSIVDYIVEHDAYGKIKSRKMWMDLSNSKKVDRTWQSLKETFLKRILVDIHNPYYKLTVDQISSFIRGQDVTTKGVGKLELHSKSDDSNDNELKTKASTSNGYENTGEKTNILKHHRESADTIVLDSCSLSEEDSQPKPEEHGKDREDKVPSQPVSKMTSLKPLRDLTYDKPLISTLQEVLDDFNTDDEDEPRLVIVEASKEMKSNEKFNLVEDVLETISEVKNNEKVEKNVTEKSPTREIKNNLDSNESVPILKKSLRLKKSGLENKNKITSTSSTTDGTILTEVSKEHKTNENSTIISSDTLIPNNQEAYKEKHCHKACESDISNSEGILNQENTNLTTNNKIHSSDENVNEKMNETNKSEKFVKFFEISCADNVADNFDKSDKADIINTVEKVNNVDSQINPCLQSVSLCAEQLTNTKFSDSRENDIAENQKDNIKNKEQKDTENFENVPRNNYASIVLSSNSESESSKFNSLNKIEKGKLGNLSKNRNIAMAKIFGHTSGSSKNKKNNLKRVRPNYVEDLVSDFSEWTSESDSDYYEKRPCSRRVKITKHIKPPVFGLESLDGSGNIMVATYKNKVFPIMKDGKHVEKTFALVNDDLKSKEYWKSKYMEETKRCEALLKLLNNMNADGNVPRPAPSYSPIIQPNISRIPTVKESNKTEEKTIEPCRAVREESAETKLAHSVKLKFTYKDNEIQLEGHSSQIYPMFEQLMQLLHKNDPRPEQPLPLKQSIVRHTSISSDGSHRLAIPDEEIRQNVQNMENEIFREIQEHAENESEHNVTLRKRPKSAKESLASPKKSKLMNNNEEPELNGEVSVEQPNSEIIGEKEKSTSPTEELNGATTTVNVRKKKTSKKPLSNNENIEENASSNISDATTKSENKRKKLPKNTENKKNIEKNETEASQETLYRFPTSSEKQLSNITASIKEPRSKRTRSNKQFESPENSQSSMNSNGYCKESYISDSKMQAKKKKRLSSTTVFYRDRMRFVRNKRGSRSASSDSSSDSYRLNNNAISSSKYSKNTDSTLKSDVYKSESYRALMISNRKKKSFSRSLSNIVEISPTHDVHVSESGKNTLKVPSFDDVENKSDPKENNSSQGCSSSISFSLSPVLSVAENMSFNEKCLADTAEMPTINDTHFNEMSLDETYLDKSKYMISMVDVTLPLMEQQCQFKENAQISALQSPSSSEQAGFLDKTLCDIGHNAVVSQSLAAEHMSVDNYDGFRSVSESLNEKLKNLLLESVKKMTATKKQNGKVTNKTNGRKRSSTPRKRNNSTKSEPPSIVPIIEEEHMESCSYRGRRSCPIVTLMSIDTNDQTVLDDIDIDISSVTRRESKGRNKKNVIKVKIVKPNQNNNKRDINLFTNDIKCKGHEMDSGICNNTTRMQSFNDSVELIHNHSETCLQTHDFHGDSSVENIRSAKSVTSLNFVTLSNGGKIIPEIYCEDAQDAADLINGNIMNNEESCNTQYETCTGGPTTAKGEINASYDSLITEDLSDEDIPQTQSSTKTKSYLSSEDESNYVRKEDVSRSCGSRLEHIFPVVCAVPDLSVITEISRETDQSSQKQASCFTPNGLDG